MEFSVVDEAKRKGFNLYGGLDPANVPRYTRKDAERATGVPASTVGVWVHGMPYTNTKGDRDRYEPVIDLPNQKDPRLSFNNLLEVNVLRALREVHEVRLRVVRQAMENARQEWDIDRLLIHPNLRATNGKLFLDYYFQLTDLSNTKQLVMRSLLADSLKRVEVDEELLARAFFPEPRFMPKDSQPILVSPFISFGNAILERRGISTYAIRSRVDSGESPESIKEDYEVTEEEFQEAIRYEAAA
ncbi:MAG: DUF433 domain-containing protein [Gemmatimonadota bacterium]|nr:DUF433 domain-containing protein [Gemmatimonadota bacterium]